ncbi:predicted protein [Nematostella vectensis]|uniref:Syntaxin-18 n=1 Tax=Nematostella vectensis TaxID=45351 RepID=A7SBH7_NEMVE|nr:predicted protein [Nematostella vectensis]|eukprot:XP_001631010.1 predicted protein [Nematostella vectensis]
MDRTTLLKASIKTIRTRNKALGVKESGKNTSILPTRNKNGRESDFGKRARDVRANITILKEFLVKHRKDYIDAFSHLSSEVSKMTDTERDQIDNDAQMYMRTCHNSIKLLKNEVPKKVKVVCEQLNTHRDNVIEMLEEYLKVVCKLYSEQRAIRVKRAVDKKRISRLQPEHTRRKHDLFAKAECMPGHAPKARESNSENKPLIGEEVSKPDVEEELSPDEVQLFIAHSCHLFCRQIEGRVVEISQLQEIFSEKVLQQSGQIDRIYETAVGTTENVKDGNEHIREAIKNNASFRVWIIFFLVMCSFSLLFLDWYS